MKDYIPDPKYDHNVNLLVRAFKAAIRAIAAELSRLSLEGLSRANAKVALVEVASILRELNKESEAWVERYIPASAMRGVSQAIVDLGIVSTLEEANKIAKFNRINREFVLTAITDTQADLLAVTQNVDRRVRQAIRQATAESMRTNLARGVNGRRTINADIQQKIQKTLGSAVDTGIIDSAGRRWKPDVYVDMVTRTKLANTQRESAVNEAVGRGAFYGQISRHGATDDCRGYEGRIVALTIANSSIEYPYYGDLPRRQIFHPCCRHIVRPIRDPTLLTAQESKDL